MATSLPRSHHDALDRVHHRLDSAGRTGREGVRRLAPATERGEVRTGRCAEWWVAVGGGDTVGSAAAARGRGTLAGAAVAVRPRRARHHHCGDGVDAAGVPWPRCGSFPCGGGTAAAPGWQLGAYCAGHTAGRKARSGWPFATRGRERPAARGEEATTAGRPAACQGGHAAAACTAAQGAVAINKRGQDSAKGRATRPPPRLAIRANRGC